jgi:hypothetical protein
MFFMYDLFNDVSRSDPITSNGKILNESWTGKNMDGSGHRLFQAIIETEENSVNLSQGGRCSCRNSNWPTSNTNQEYLRLSQYKKL